MSRGWCFTCYGYDIETFKSPIEKIITEYKADYCVYQLEKCPETGRLHIQGYIHFPANRTFVTIKKILPDGAHIEKQRGTVDEAADYCCKEESRVAGPVEIGERPQQGKRNDLAEVAAVIREGARLEDVAEMFPEQTIRYGRGLERYQQLLLGRRERPIPRVHVRWGAPGVGKTRYVYDNHPAVDIYSVIINCASERCWWSGYAGHKVVLFDDWPGGWGYSDLLRWLDRYPVQVETKGGSTWLLAEDIYITSNAAPGSWYQWTQRQREALFRRFTDVTEVAGNTIPPLPDLDVDSLVAEFEKI